MYVKIGNLPFLIGAKFEPQTIAFYFKHRNTLIFYVIQLKFRDLNVKIDK